MQPGLSPSLSIAGHVYETDDVQAANAYINAHVTDHRLNVLHRDSRIAFSCRRFSVGEMQVCDFSYGRAEVEVRLERTQSKAYFLVVPLTGRATITRGGNRHVLLPGSAMVFATAEENETRFLDSSDFRNVNIRLSAASVDEFLVAEFGRPLWEEVSFGTEPVAIGTGLQHLVDYARSIASRLDDPQSLTLYAGRYLARHTHDLLLSLLIASMPNNYREAYQSPASRRLAPTYIRKAEDYMRQHARESLRMADVARAAGVAPRTLQLGFNRHKNYSALEFLRNERLGLAHQALLDARQRNVSVTDIAYDCGFVHLSRFASAYLRRYGEKPSETYHKSS